MSPEQMRERAAVLCDERYLFETAEQIRAIPIPPTPPDPSAEALKLAEEALKPFADIAEYGDKHAPQTLDTDETCASVRDFRRANAALAAIRKITGGGVMLVSGPLPNDDPRLIAWKAYCQTPEYEDIFNWAKNEAHRKGSLWAAFLEGCKVANADLRARLAAAERERDEARQWFAALQKAIVGETGASAILTVEKMRATIAAQSAALAEARAALKDVIERVQEWCEAVARDSSWDGWDHHYKQFAHGGLDKLRVAIAAIDALKGPQT